MGSTELHSGDPEYKNTLKNGSEDPSSPSIMANEENGIGNAAAGGNGTTLPTL